MDVYQRRRLVALSAVAAVFIVLVLLIKSCGGSDEPSTALTAPVSGASGASGAAGPLTLDAYIQQGDDICLQANTALAGVDTSDTQQAATDKAQILAGELQQLQSLQPPDENSNKLDNFLSALKKQQKGYEDEATAAERGDDATVNEVAATIEQQAAEAKTAAK